MKKIGLEVLKFLFTLVTFIAMYWTFNFIWGDGQAFTSQDVLFASISAFFFYLIFYHIFPYVSSKIKRRRNA